MSETVFRQRFSTIGVIGIILVFGSTILTFGLWALHIARIENAGSYARFQPPLILTGLSVLCFLAGLFMTLIGREYYRHRVVSGDTEPRPPLVSLVPRQY